MTRKGPQEINYSQLIQYEILEKLVTGSVNCIVFAHLVHSHGYGHGNFHSHGLTQNHS